MPKRIVALICLSITIGTSCQPDSNDQRKSPVAGGSTSVVKATDPLNDDLTEEQLEAFFRKHTVSGKPVVAVKRLTTLSSGSSYVSYLSTIHGYPDNLGVCNRLIAEYNENPSLTVIGPAQYFCEVVD